MCGWRLRMGTQSRRAMRLMRGEAKPSLPPPAASGGDGTGVPVDAPAAGGEEAGDSKAALSGAGAEEEEEEEGAAGEASKAEKAKTATAPLGLWTPSGWRSIASRALKATQSERGLRQHGRLRALVVGKEALLPGRPVPTVARCKLEMLDVLNALPVPPPEEGGESLAPGSDGARRQWAALIRDAETPAMLSAILLRYVKQLPPTAFKQGFREGERGFRRWWLHEEGPKEKPKPPQADNLSAVLLRLHCLDAGLAYF